MLTTITSSDSFNLKLYNVMNLLRISESVGNYTYFKLNLPSIENYIDIDLLKWFIYLFTPVVITFLLPLLIILLLYTSALIIFIYRHRQRLDLAKIKDAFERKHYWDGALHAVAVMWEAHGFIWHSYEVEGFDNIPNEGPALIVYYHGAIPLDYYYLSAKCLLYKKRLIRAVGDHFLFRIPGWKLMMEVLQVFPGSISGCTKVLEGGDLLSIAPGGVREAQFGDERYRLLWGQRCGFAKVAIEAKVPIIPVFTQNIREAFRSIRIGKNIFEKLYERIKIPIVPIYGGFPVKLRTIIGKPIEFDSSLTAEQLAQKTAQAIEDLIRRNQRIPGSIFKAIAERFYNLPKEKHI